MPDLIFWIYDVLKRNLLGKNKSQTSKKQPFHFNINSTLNEVLGEKNCAAFKSEIGLNTVSNFAQIYCSEIIKTQQLRMSLNQMEKEFVEFKKNMNEAMFYLKNSLNELEKKFETMEFALNK